MKRLIVILGLVLMSVAVKAISWSYFYDGLWSEWSPRYFARASGNWHDFVIYNANGGSIHNYLFRITIDNPETLPDKKQRKVMFKNKQWLEFTGTIEYYICDDYPTAYDIFKKNWQWIEYNYSDTRPVIKVKKIVTIKISPTKGDKIGTYNLWWENVGFGFSFD